MRQSDTIDVGTSPKRSGVHAIVATPAHTHLGRDRVARSCRWPWTRRAIRFAKQRYRASTAYANSRKRTAGRTVVFTSSPLGKTIPYCALSFRSMRRRSAVAASFAPGTISASKASASWWSSPRDRLPSALQQAASDAATPANTAREAVTLPKAGSASSSTSWATSRNDWADTSLVRASAGPQTCVRVRPLGLTEAPRSRGRRSKPRKGRRRLS